MTSILCQLVPAVVAEGATRPARRSVATWARTVPALAGCAGVEDVLARCHDRSDPARAHDAVAALIGLAATEPLAGRVALAALAPGLGAVAARLEAAAGWRRRDELEAILVGAAWEQIVVMAAGPVPAWPAQLIVSRSRDRARTWLAAETRHRHNTERLDAAEPMVADPAEIVAGCADLAARVRSGRVTRDGLEVVVATRWWGLELGEWAATRGVSTATARQRRWRAEQILRAA